jgi:hypothetical protein
VTAGYMQGKRIAVVSRMACSRWVLEEGAHRKYPEHAMVPAEALARLAAVDVVAAAAVVVVVAVVVVDVAAAAAAVVVAAAVAAAVPVVAVEARELASFVADHQRNYQTFRWTW